MTWDRRCFGFGTGNVASRSISACSRRSSSLTSPRAASLSVTIGSASSSSTSRSEGDGSKTRRTWSWPPWNARSNAEICSRLLTWPSVPARTSRRHTFAWPLAAAAWSAVDALSSARKGEIPPLRSASTSACAPAAAASRSSAPAPSVTTATTCGCRTSCCTSASPPVKHSMWKVTFCSCSGVTCGSRLGNSGPEQTTWPSRRHWSTLPRSHTSSSSPRYSSTSEPCLNHCSRW